MRKTREILRQKWGLGRSHREVARSLGVSLGAVSATLTRATAAGLDWERGRGALGRGARGAAVRRPGRRRPERPLPDSAVVHAEHKRPGRDARAAAPRVPGAAPGRLPLHAVLRALPARGCSDGGSSMRQVHRAGEKLLRRLLGQEARRSSIAATGEVIEVELFVAVLGASNYTYAEATRDAAGAGLDREPRARASSSSAACPSAVVPDQLKSGVTTRVPLRARHPAHATRSWRSTTARRSCRRARQSRATRRRSRSRVQIAQRWILARLRNETFFSLAALNERIARAARRAQRPHDARYGASRRELFERARSPGSEAAAGDALRARASGRRRASTSTTTSSSTTTTTRSRTLLRPREVESALTGDDGRDLPARASASRRTRAARCAAATRRPRRTCRRPTRRTLEWTPSRIARVGGERSGPTRRRSSRRSSPSARTRSRAIARASGILRLAQALRRRAARGRVRARASPSARARTATSTRS